MAEGYEVLMDLRETIVGRYGIGRKNFALITGRSCLWQMNKVQRDPFLLVDDTGGPMKGLTFD